MTIVGVFRSFATRGVLPAAVAVGLMALPAWAQDEDPEPGSDPEDVAELQGPATAPGEGAPEAGGAQAAGQPAAQ